MTTKTEQDKKQAQAKKKAQAETLQTLLQSAIEGQAVLTNKRDTDSTNRRNMAFWKARNTVFIDIGNNEYMAVLRVNHKLDDTYKVIASTHGQGQFFTMARYRVEQYTDSDTGKTRSKLVRYAENYGMFIMTSKPKNDADEHPTEFFTTSGKKWTSGAGDYAKRDLTERWVDIAVLMAKQTGKITGRVFMQSDSPIVLKVDNESNEPTAYKRSPLATQ